MVVIKGLEKFAPKDFPGIISATLFVGGCNFRCPYCHNSDLVLRPQQLPDFPLDYLLRFFDERQNWLEGVCITGGEPLLDPEITTFCSLLKNRNLRVKIDTNGSLPSKLRQLLDENLVDVVAMDIKTSLDKYGLVSQAIDEVALKIKESIDLLLQTDKEVIFRTTVVPGLVEMADINKIAKLIEKAPLYVLQQFEPQNTLDESYESLKPYPSSFLEEAAQAARAFVQKVKIEGI
ncbi:MAG TPA: anaerobic ribonucleoside-triphosphate reductase activating protein [Candidatus Aminicenantes bacterium]|nr:anaerobic ribonucleoside-triphosphate reductase activating protein [Candidatus Aminicenantes bacterium]